MVLHNVQANADNNKAPQIRKTLVKNGSFQDFTELSGINIDLSKLSDDNTDQIGNELSDYASAYNNVLNNVDNSRVSQIKHLMVNRDKSNLSDNVDNQKVMDDASRLNQLADAMKGVASQSDQEVKQDNIKNKTNAIRNICHQDNFSDVSLNGQNFNVDKMSDDDAINLYNKLSQFNDEYAGIVNNASTQKATPIRNIVKKDFGIDNVASKDSDGLVNNTIPKVEQTADDIQGTINSKDYTSAKDDATKASLIKNTLKKHHPSFISYVGEKFDPAKFSKDSDALNAASQLNDFANDYRNINSKDYNPQAEALRPYLKNADESNLSNKSNDEIVQMGKNTSKLGSDIKSGLPKDASQNDYEQHKADKIRNVLNEQGAKDIPVYIQPSNSAVILDPTNMSNQDALKLPDNLAQFTKGYQDVQNNATTNQAAQLKPLIKKFNNSDVSNKDDATVIKLGADLNEAAKNVQSDLKQATDNDKKPSNDNNHNNDDHSSDKHDSSSDKDKGHDNSNDSDGSKNDDHSKDDHNDHQNGNHDDNSKNNHDSDKSDNDDHSSDDSKDKPSDNGDNGSQDNHNDHSKDNNDHSGNKNDGHDNGNPSDDSKNDGNHSKDDNDNHQNGNHDDNSKDNHSKDGNDSGKSNNDDSSSDKGHKKDNDGSKNNDSNGSNNTSGGSTINVNPATNDQANHNDPNYHAPEFNDGSHDASFPTAPASNPSAHQASHHKKAKLSAKQWKKRLKKDKKNVKKARKRLKKAHKHARKAKGRTRKEHMKKVVRSAEKAVAHAEIKYNRDKRAAK